MKSTETIFEEAKLLNPTERVRLIDQLMATIDIPDPNLDQLWKKEAENRIEAYEQGKIRAVSVQLPQYQLAARVKKE